MAYNFLRCDRDQSFLLPPDLRDWLPQDHLAWFILDVVDQLDLAAFHRAHRDDGHGHPAYDPKLLLGVLLHGYCLGVRSSRQLERPCHEDIAFRVLAANQAGEADQREDLEYGQTRGDELPDALASKASRLARLRQAKALLEAEAAERARRFAEWAAASAAAAAAKGKPPPTLKPRAGDEAPSPKATANITDPDSRLLHTRRGRVQGYNAQAVTTSSNSNPAPGHYRHAGGRRDRRTSRHAGSGLGLLVDRQPDPAPNAPQLLIPRPSSAATASPARTAGRRHPAVTGCARR